MDRIFYELECYLKSKAPVTRNAFLKMCLAGLAGFVASNGLLKSAFAKETPSSGRTAKNIKGNFDLVAAEGKDPYQNTVKVIEKMGGMERFVKKGSTVVVKPNIGWDRTPEQAANTNPQVVAALVDLCYKAGAKRVNVFDITCNDERLCYEHSGIQKAADARGAKVYYADEWNMVKAHFPYESPMEGWQILKDAVDCDTFINVPVLKHHQLTGLTLSIKNLMGVCGGTRGLMHIRIGRKLADILDFIKPELTVIDATRVLTRHGPVGGDLADVVKMDTVFAATDAVLADAYAASLMKVSPLTIPYIESAVSRNLGSAEIAKARIEKIRV